MDHSVVTTQVTLAGIGVALVQWLKSTRFFPWASTETAKLNRALALGVSGLAAVGVHLTWATGMDHGTYIITITGATLGGILTMAWVWLKQFAMQEIVYRTTTRNGTGLVMGANPLASAQTRGAAGTAPAAKP